MAEYYPLNTKYVPPLKFYSNTDIKIDIVQ